MDLDMMIFVLFYKQLHLLELTAYSNIQLAYRQELYLNIYIIIYSHIVSYTIFLHLPSMVE